jgi:23S rRNA pseudouridine1911/1915/1917 synthase
MSNLKNLYEDDFIILFDKPQGLATGIGENENLCEKVFESFPEIEKVHGYNKKEGGLLNRLDNETGGIVFFAKTDEAFLFYSKKMKNEEIEKIYTAIVEGIPETNYGIIDFPIAHHKKNQKKMVVLKNKEEYRSKPQKAKTRWEVIKSKNTQTLLKIKIRKGTRHQIRIHLASIGMPIVGDAIYNKKIYPGINNHLLYATGTIFINHKNQKIEVFTEASFSL